MELKSNVEDALSDRQKIGCFAKKEVEGKGHDAWVIVGGKRQK